MAKEMSKKVVQERKVNIGEGINKKIIANGRDLSKKALDKKKRGAAW